MYFDLTALPNATNVTTVACNANLPITIPFIKSVSGLWVVWTVALLFVLLSWAVSVYLIYKHLKFYTQPEHQRYIVRLLCMVPLYSLYSLLSLILHQHQIYFAIARDCYEAYALFMFFKLCVSYGGGKEAIIEHFLSQPKQRLTFPLNCWEVQPNELFFTVCKQGMLQYVLIRPIVSIWAAVLAMFGAYNDGSFAASSGYLYASLINNVCVCIALYIVVLFEQAAKELLHPYRPILKFLSVKMVIFLAFWQSIAIAFMAHFGWIPSVYCLSTGDVATGLQNLLMCFEMFLVALLHVIAYPYELYRVRALTTAPIDNTVKSSVLKNMVNMINQADLLKDTLESLAIRHSSAPRTSTSLSAAASYEGSAVLAYTAEEDDMDGGPSDHLDGSPDHGLLINASFEPESAPPLTRTMTPRTPLSPRAPLSPRSPRSPRIPEPPPRPVPVITNNDFDPRGRRGSNFEMDDDLLDDLDDEDLDYEHLRR